MCAGSPTAGISSSSQQPPDNEFETHTGLHALFPPLPRTTKLQTPLRNPSDAQGAISAPEIFEASPRVCPELEGLLLPDWPILRSSFDESDGLLNRTGFHQALTKQAKTRDFL